MKKIALSFLAFIGTLAVFVGPVEVVHASEPIEIAPLCIVAPNPVYRVAIGTTMWRGSTGSDIVFNWVPVGTQVGGTGVRRDGRTQVRWQGQTGWIPSGRLTRISC